MGDSCVNPGFKESCGFLTKRALSMFSILPFIRIFLFIFCSSVLRFCNGADIISAGQSISEGQNITSAGDIFVLGFFSPGNSQNRYIGIWYKKVLGPTVVWVANRETPLTDASGILRIGNDGNLMIQDGTGRTLWSTNTAVARSKAVLLDTGNLIISSSTDGEIVWQSFDYPSNTFLPGMKLGLNLNTGQNWLLTSWRNAEDPASGSFVLGMDPDRSSQFFIWKKGVRYWASGAWNGQTFTGIPEMRRNYIFNFTYINNYNNQIFTYSMYDTSIISRLIIDLDGKVKELTWLESSQQWVLFWSQPNGTCDIYSMCGAFGTCKEYDLPHCSCLPGFEPQSPKDWNSSDWSEGCTRSSGLKCGNVDVFSPLNRMKLPVGARSLVVLSRQDCEAECQRNCSCTAYALVNGTRCLVWGGALVDLQQFTSTGEDLYIRLAAPVFQDAKITGSKSPNKVILVIIIVTTSLGMILLVTCIIFSWRRRQKERGMRETSQELSLFDLSSPVEIENNFTHANNLVEDTKNGTDLPIFNFGSVVAATDNFSIANKLGEGGFGPVYKGKLLGGQEVAVKRLSMSSGQGLEEFKNEVVLIAKLQHRNLVRVLGCCIQGREKILIYEYMPNRSLDFFLFDPTKRAILDWEKRFRIVEGITQGLLYLHQHSRLRIIHRDLKASNILLDGEMNPRISDFGMARMFGENQAQANTRRVVGTYGYMAPEYALEGRFSVKSDVFSFGVMLLEIVSGKRNTGIYQFEQSLNLLGYVWELWKEGRGLELLDPSLGDLCPRGEVLKCIHVGLLCVQEDAGDRPTMSSVILMLASESMTLPAPKKPAFSIGSSSSSRPLTCSANDVTITTADGR